MRLFFLVFLMAILSGQAPAQWRAEELTMIENQTFTERRFEPRKPEYVFKNNSLLVKFNPLSLFFGGMLFFYQKAISPQISVECPYEINCSNFSKQCIRHFGLLKGVALTSDRLTRCTPYTLIDRKTLQFSRKEKILDQPSDYRTGVK